MVTRREWLAMTAGAGASLALQGCVASAEPDGAAASAGTAAATGTATAADKALIMRPIPSSGELLPVVGLGSSATFSSVARREDKTALKEVFKTMVEMGARVFDTAPAYGASEQVAADIVNELGIADKIFWATKVNTAGRGTGTANVQASRAMIETSFRRIKKPKIDLIQVHNLGDVPTQLKMLNDLKKEGRLRYTGITCTDDQNYGMLVDFIRNEQMDFIGVDYALDAREVEATILPLAMQRKIAVMVYVPLGRNRLFRRVEGRQLPAWAADFDATTWAQFFIKYVVSHPAVTAVTPATSNPLHMADDIGGGMGRLPDEATRKRMAEFIDALPPAPGR